MFLLQKSKQIIPLSLQPNRCTLQVRALAVLS